MNDPNNDSADPKTLAPDLLGQVSGGMKWEEFRPSTNVEDRRSPTAIRRDQEWWTKTYGPSQPTTQQPTTTSGK